MIVFTFPGQGSQKPGMGDAWRDHPSWELVAEASSVLGRDLEHLLLHTEAEEITRTAEILPAVIEKLRAVSLADSPVAFS